jgi:hypothetical protein
MALGKLPALASRSGTQGGLSVARQPAVISGQQVHSYRALIGDRHRQTTVQVNERPVEERVGGAVRRLLVAFFRPACILLKLWRNDRVQLSLGQT